MPFLRKKFDVAFVAAILCLILMSSLFVELKAAEIVKVDVAYRSPRLARAVDGWNYRISLHPAAPGHIGVYEMRMYWERFLKTTPDWYEISMLRNNFTSIQFEEGWYNAPGTFNIMHYDAIKNDEASPNDKMFEVLFIADRKDFPPAPYTLRWIQFIYTDCPIRKGLPRPYVDPQPNDDNLPFYWTDAEIPEKIGSTNDGRVYLKFMDKPCRLLNRPTINWRAHLFLVGWNARDRIVHFYDGIEYGFKIRRVAKSQYAGPDVCGGVGSLDKEPYEKIHTGVYIYGWDPIDVSNILVSPTILVPGEIAHITLTIENQGDFEETNFDVAVYADQNESALGDEIVVGSQAVASLPVNGTINLDFFWDTTGLPYGSYIISAEAAISQVTGMPLYYDLDEFNVTGRIVDIDFPVALTLRGDINEDRIVDIFDLVIIGVAFGSRPGDENWNLLADIVRDEEVDIFDIVTVAVQFGQQAR